MNQQQHKTTKMDSQPKNDEKKDDKTNEDTEWKNHMLDAMRELKNEMQDLRSEIVAQRRAINDNDVKLEEKVEELRSTLCDSVMNVRESIQTVSDALGDHVHQSEGKNCELRSSIVQVENRITSSFERLSNEIKACRDTQEAYKEELLGNIERLDQERYEDLGAVEDMAGHIPEIEERLTELQRLREAVPPISFIESRLDRLEGRVQTLDMEQRDTAHSLIATGRHVEAWEETLTQQIREVAQDVTNLQGMAAEHAEPVPSEEGSLGVANQPPDPNPDGISWFHNSPTPGNTTLMENSFMRDFMNLPPRRRVNRDEESFLRGNIVSAVEPRQTEPKKQKVSRDKQRKSTGGIKKKRKANDNEDPSSSSSDTESSSSLGTNPDDRDRSRKSKKRDDDSEDESSQGEGLFKLAASGEPKRNRRESIIGDESSTSTSNRDDRGGKRHSESKVIYVQPAPRTDDFRLKEIRIGTVLYFCKAFNNAASQFRGRLNAANFIDEKLLSQMKQTAYKEDMPGANGILRNGRQKISNQELFAILAIMCAPTNTHKMQLELSKSCWPKRSEYKAIEDVAKNIANFRIDLLTYVDRFDDKLILFRSHRKSRKLIPRDVFKKGGGDPGLADYFIGGLPDKNLGLRIWASVDRKKRAKCQSFEKFKKYFILAVEAMETRDEDRDVNKQICFGVREMMKADKSKSPQQSKGKGWVTQRTHNTHRVNQLGEIDTVASDGSSNEEIEIVFTRDEEEKEELPSAIEEFEEKEDNSTITEEDVSELANLLQPPDSKVQGICYDMLYKGKCEKINCPYSHKVEDIEKAKKLKALRIASSSKLGNKSVSFNRATYPATRKA